MVKKATNPNEIQNLAHNFLNQGHYDKAIAMFRKAIKMSPMNTHMYSQLAEAFIQKGDYNGAIESYKTWIESPQNLMNLYIDHRSFSRMVGLYRATDRLDELKQQ